jgi:hypothetical protein
MPPMSWGRTGVTGRTSEVAPVRHFDQGKATVLFMVRANPTIVRAAINAFGVRLFGIFAGFVVIAYLLIILNIGSDQHLLEPVVFTDLDQEYLSFLENDLGAQLPVAFDTQADRVIVVYIVAHNK